ncbi:MAG TPA: S41 family peptidase [Fimbriimonadaceae bacterium]|nr:S41 family peptidase [Fimbriimonadaceae bacterium]
MKIVACFVVAAVAFGVGFSWKDLKHGKLPSSAAFARAVTPGADDKPTPTQVFKAAFTDIVDHYYKPVDVGDLKYAGMEGLMASLGDPHTIFMEPRSAEEFSKDTRGENEFVGVGARLGRDPLGAKIMVVFSGGPAALAGIKNGDVVAAVDGKPVGGVPVDEIVRKIRGKEGTVVTLDVIRGSNPKPIRIAIKRGRINPPTADGVVIPGTKIGLVTVLQFSDPTPEQFERAIHDLEEQGIKGLVIDLRNNPGGLLDRATDMLSMFVADKIVVKMRMKDGTEEVVRTASDAVHGFKYPVIVLVNEDSASAAEIFSGVLKDYKQATIVGEHTYGKASVQNVFNLIDGSSAKITIARYYLPSGGDISRKVDEEGQYLKGGLQPDVKVSLGTDDGISLGDPKADPQLAKAIEVIKGKGGG